VYAKYIKKEIAVLNGTGLSRAAASMELRKLERDPFSSITSKGLRSQKFYVLQEADK